jgi:hypothetical protein
MARKGKKERIRYRRMKAARHRLERTAPHSILATLVGASAAAIPFLAPDPGIYGDQSALGYLGWFADAAANGDQAGMAWSGQAAGTAFVNGVVQSIPELIGLGAVAAGIGYFGRKYAKSATNVSRKWRVF